MSFIPCYQDITYTVICFWSEYGYIITHGFKFPVFYYHIVVRVIITHNILKKKKKTLILLCCISNQHTCAHTNTQLDPLQGQDSAWNHNDCKKRIWRHNNTHLC